MPGAVGLCFVRNLIHVAKCLPSHGRMSRIESDRICRFTGEVLKDVAYAGICVRQTDRVYFQTINKVPHLLIKCTEIPVV